MKRNPLALVLGLSVAFFVIFVAISVSVVMRFAPGTAQKKIFAKSASIGVLEVKGVIIDSKKLLEQIDAFGEDPLVKGVLVHINSPGGAVAPSQEVYEALRKLSKTKTVYSSMSSLAASGGYYVACGTKKVFANPGTITGSIGVIMQFADLSKLYQWAKVSQYNIKTGRYKDIGSPLREMSLEEKQLLQNMVDNVLAQFRKAVATARSIPMEKVVAVSDGRIFTGEQAKAAQLVDELGGFNDAVEALAKDVGIQGKPNLIYPAKKRRGLERLLGDFDEDSESDSSSSVGGISSLLRLVLKAGNWAKTDGLLGEVLPSTDRLVGPLFLMPRFGQ